MLMFKDYMVIDDPINCINVIDIELLSINLRVYDVRLNFEVNE